MECKGAIQLGTNCGSCQRCQELGWVKKRERRKQIIFLQKHRCPECGGSLSFDGEEVWCSFFGDQKSGIKACDYGISGGKTLEVLFEDLKVKEALSAKNGVAMNAHYWRRRCELAEKYIEESPCDPDIYPEQMTAWAAWKDFKEKGK